MKILDVDEIAPEITGLSGKAGDLTSTVSIKENLSSIGTFAANETVTWSISGGNDQDKFSIDASTGALSFKSAPDFETQQIVRIILIL